MASVIIPNRPFRLRPSEPQELVVLLVLPTPQIFQARMLPSTRDSRKVNARKSLSRLISYTVHRSTWGVSARRHGTMDALRR